MAYVTSVTLTGLGLDPVDDERRPLPGAITASSASGSGWQLYITYGSGVTINQRADDYGERPVEGVRHDDGTLVLGSGQLGFTSSVGEQRKHRFGYAGGNVGCDLERDDCADTGWCAHASSATGGSFTASNYTITYDPGNVMITAAPLTITAIDQSRPMSDGGTLFWFGVTTVYNQRLSRTAMAIRSRR